MTVPEVNETMLNFGHPETVIAETDQWVVQLRPKQATLGSLVLVSREPVMAFGDITKEGFSALKPAISTIEAVLKRFVNYQKINYLMLMMIDKDVHFHVIPRYEGSRTYCGIEYTDAGWPGPPALGQFVAPGPADLQGLVDDLRKLWIEAPNPENS